MSDLPSREDVRDDFVDLGARSGPVEQIIRAYASGRLFDREAIDHEAAIEAWWTDYARSGQYNPATRAAIAAAIGDTQVKKTGGIETTPTPL